MDISGVSNSMLAQIANGATQNGDAVTIAVLRKAMDIQAQQSLQLIQSVTQSAPSNPNAAQHLDVWA